MLLARLMHPHKNASAGPQPHAQPQLRLASLLQEALASLAASAGVSGQPAAAGAGASLPLRLSSSLSPSLNGRPRQSFGAGSHNAEPRTPRVTEAAAYRSSSEPEELVGKAVRASAGGPTHGVQRSPLEGLLRRRFCSQVRRGVLRIRIAGADPDQLPAEWRELVAAHFTGESL